MSYKCISMNKKFILAMAVLMMLISVSSVSAGENSTDLTSMDEDVLQDSDEEILQDGDDSAQKINTKIVSDPIFGDDGDSISVVVEIWDENDEPVMNGTAALVVGDMMYGSYVENGTAVFTGVLIREGMTKAWITYFGDEYYNSSDLEVLVFVGHEIYPEIPTDELDDSLNVTASPCHPAGVKAVKDLKATGNPIFAVMLSLMIMSSAGIINRRR